MKQPVTGGAPDTLRMVDPSDPQPGGGKAPIGVKAISIKGSDLAD